MLPVVTIIGLQLGALLAGAVLTETVFNLSGVGRTMFEAITGRDYVVIQGFTLLIAVFYVLVNLLVDVSYGFLDPRVRRSDEPSAVTARDAAPARVAPRAGRRARATPSPPACGATRWAASFASARRWSGS